MIAAMVEAQFAGRRVENVISETADEDQLGLRHAGERFSVLPTI